MISAWLIWGELAVCAAVIAVAGSVLTRYGDAIARLSGLTRSWIGLALLATATSLPELFTGISSITLAGTPNIAVGDVLGSCVLNMMLLVLLDALNGAETVFRRIDQGHVLTAAFGVVMIGLVGGMILVGHPNLQLQVLGVGAYAPIVVILYLVSMRASFSFERRHKRAEEMEARGSVSKVRALYGYGLAALVVAGAGSALPFIGLDIARAMGWQTSFVGTLFIAAATSLPEAVVVVAAARLGATDMAVANLLGSNLFNLVILAIDDVAYRKGPLLWAVSPANAISAFAAVMMSGVFIVAAIYRPETRILGVFSWVSLLLALIYFASSYAVYLGM